MDIRRIVYAKRRIARILRCHVRNRHLAVLKNRNSKSAALHIQVAQPDVAAAVTDSDCRNRHRICLEAEPIDGHAAGRLNVQQAVEQIARPCARLQQRSHPPSPSA